MAAGRLARDGPRLTGGEALAEPGGPTGVAAGGAQTGLGRHPPRPRSPGLCTRAARFEVHFGDDLASGSFPKLIGTAQATKPP